MAPKKGKKMALNEFLVDDSLGSWADEMDSLPTAPSLKTDEDRTRERENRRGGGDFRDRDFPSRDFPPREELPLPTKPPYIAFVGNLAFDVYEDVVAEFFSPNELKDIKIIKDRDEKPKGFGYVEFATLDGLKDGLARSGTQMMNRTVRISVAEPPKERTHGFDEDRFAGPWRREGPLPTLPPSSSRPGGDRPGFGSGFSNRAADGDNALPGVAETSNDWRANRPTRAAPPPDRPAPPSRRPSAPSDAPVHPAHLEQTWSIGSKFKASVPSPEPPTERKSLFGGKRGDSGFGSGATPEEDGDWRAAPRRTVSHSDSARGSPSTSTPPTPQLGGRRKLELLPRGTSSPAADSPLSSPKSATTATHKASPFGAARPVDASAREREVEERLEQDRITRAAKEKERENSRFGSGLPRSPPPAKSESALPSTAPSKTSPTIPSSTPPATRFSSTANVVRPTISFAAAAAAKKATDDSLSSSANDQETANGKDDLSKGGAAGDDVGGPLEVSEPSK